VRLSGKISNAPAVGALTVAVAGRTANVGPQGAYSVEIQTPGTYDVFVLHGLASVVNPGGLGDVTIDQVLAQRGVAITADTTQPLDFAGAAAVQSFGVTMGATSANAKLTNDTTLTAGGTTLTLEDQTAPPFATESLATTQMVSTDVYVQELAVSQAGSTLVVQGATATPAAEVFVPPAALGGALASVAAATPYPQIKTTWSTYTNAVGYTWALAQAQTAAQCTGSAACTVTWVADVSAAYAGAATSYQMPDLSALAGWSAELQLVAGTQVTGTVEAETSSAGATDFPALPPAAGTLRTFARAVWTATP
jgi:hypothetical protein